MRKSAHCVSLHGDTKGTACTVTLTGKQSIVRSASIAAYAITSDYRDIDQSICHACNRQEPPTRKSKRINADIIACVGCDFCPCWCGTSE